MHDLRFALRQFAKSPAFTAVAVGTLGLGIAVNAVFLDVTDTLFFRPLPAHEPERLVVIATKGPNYPYQIPVRTRTSLTSAGSSSATAARCRKWPGCSAAWPGTRSRSSI